MATRQTRLGHGILQLGTPDALHKMEGQVFNVVMDPKVSKKDAREMLSGDMVGGERKVAWTMKGKILDDFGIAGSTVEFCHTNQGKDLPFEFIPSDKSKKKITGQLTVDPLPIGGDIGSVNEIDFEFDILDHKIAEQA